MNALFQLTSQAIEDLDAICWTIVEDNRDAAEQVEMEILATCHRLARHPRMGTKRQDITMLPVRFWTITKFPNYVIPKLRTREFSILSPDLCQCVKTVAMDQRRVEK
jgi:plasmid stabilization system protein ParE